MKQYLITRVPRAESHSAAAINRRVREVERRNFRDSAPKDNGPIGSSDNADFDPVSIMNVFIGGTMGGVVGSAGSAITGTIIGAILGGLFGAIRGGYILGHMGGDIDGDGGAE